MTRHSLLAAGWLAATIALAAPAASAAGRDLDLRVLHHEALRDLRVDRAGRPASFEALGRRFELDLEPNDRLRFVTREKVPGVEVLRGALRGLPRSWVRVTRTPAGLYGLVSDGHDVYVIEPAEELAGRAVGPLAARGRGAVLYRLADTLMPPGGATCATGTAQAIAGGPVTGQQHFDAVAGELQAGMAAATLAPNRQLQVAVVGDFEFSQLAFGSGLTAEQAIATRMNFVDGIYSSQVGVKLVFDSVTVFRDPADPFSDTLVPGTLLTELGNWRQSTPAQSSRGLSHLMTGRDLEGTTVGIAYLDALCRSRFGAGLSQATGLGTTTHSLVIAHEIGHNFGAVHDGEAGSACEAAPQTFLMAPRVNGSSQFSQCSLDTMAPSVQAAACITARAVADATLDLPAPAARPRGTAFDYGFAVRSVGENTVENVTVSVSLPAALTLNSGAVQGGSACTVAGANVTCSVGSIAPGGSRTINFNLTGQQTGTSTANFFVAASNDEVAANDRGSASFTVEPSADLGTSLGASPASIAAGGSTQLTATVRHLGGDAVADARLAFTIPAGLAVTAVGSNALGCSLAAGAVSCTASPIAAGATASVVVTLRGDQAGSRNVSISVASSVSDPVAGNDAAEAQVEVQPATSGGGSGGGTAGGGGGGGGGSTGLLSLLALLASLWAGTRLRAA